ncbi:hypothetical protein IWZ03DRAFT_218131 [Phyllosticta citriasiana]|uniref:Uncharacterized protein n=1 Tax=Phyllosticta citriasiana TaxID=595635 RepID=A0ABR1KGI3_9PEZI
MLPFYSWTGPSVPRGSSQWLSPVPCRQCLVVASTSRAARQTTNRYFGRDRVHVTASSPNLVPTQWPKDFASHIGPGSNVLLCLYGFTAILSRNEKHAPSAADLIRFGKLHESKRRPCVTWSLWLLFAHLACHDGFLVVVVVVVAVVACWALKQTRIPWKKHQSCSAILQTFVG